MSGNHFSTASKLSKIFITSAVFLVCLLLILIFIPRATVHINVNSEPVVKSFKVLLDSKLTTPNYMLSVIPTHVVAQQKNISTNEPINGYVSDKHLFRNINGHTETFLFNPDDLKTLAVNELNSVLQEDRELQVKNLKINIVNSVLNFDEGYAEIEAMAESVVLPKLPTQKIRDLHLKNPEDIKQKFLSFKNVTSVDIDISPSFWPFLPYFDGNLVFSVDTIY